MESSDLFYIQQDNIYAVPIIHYNMEMAAQVKLAFEHIKPDCVAVELAETMQLQLLHAASRLPDIGIVITYDREQTPLYYMCEPCDGAFEGLRSALENHIPAWCIDLDVDYYPDIREIVPDPYAVHRIGLKNYYEVYQKLVLAKNFSKSQIDYDREMHMAKRLKELSLSFDRILFVGGMAHIENILAWVKRDSFPIFQHSSREAVQLCTLTEQSCREIMLEYGWISSHYEKLRQEFVRNPEISPFFPPDRQKLIYELYKDASNKYMENTGNAFPGYHLRNIMKFVRNYSLIKEKLMPDLYQILSSAKGCVDHNYAYEVWEMATHYPYRRNVDGLTELDLSVEQVWGNSKMIQFHLKEKGHKSSFLPRKRKDRSQFRFSPPAPFTICSYPPEDIVVENFGEFLKKKGTQLLTEEAARTEPFSGSLEDGVDTKETIRHWPEKKLYVKVRGRPQGGVGSVVIIFDEDSSEEHTPYVEKFPWRTTWLGEHTQESDMAFYATRMTDKVVGPGISRCEYGGFMMSYPPRRMFDVWHDPDYEACRTKAEVLLMAAIDYAAKPIIAYVGSKPPRSQIKSYARRFGKKIVYIPIGQLSPITLNKIRAFHVLDGYDKRDIADEYIY